MLIKLTSPLSPKPILKYLSLFLFENLFFIFVNFNGSKIYIFESLKALIKNEVDKPSFAPISRIFNLFLFFSCLNPLACFSYNLPLKIVIKIYLSKK